MIKDERKDMIVRRIQERGILRIEEMEEMMGVQKMKVRRDINQMEEKGSEI